MTYTPGMRIAMLVVFLLGTSQAGVAWNRQDARPKGFDRTLTLLGVTFKVTCANDSSLPSLRIVPSGLAVDNAPIVREVNGLVTGAEVADLDQDGSPEIYVYVESAGSGSYGSVVAYAANNRKSLSEAYMPPLDQHPTAARDYQGHDRFAVEGNRLVRRFPIYREGDTNAAPSGGSRQIDYALAKGEAGWLLKIEHVGDR